MRGSLADRVCTRMIGVSLFALASGLPACDAIFGIRPGQSSGTAGSGGMTTASSTSANGGPTTGSSTASSGAMGSSSNAGSSSASSGATASSGGCDSAPFPATPILDDFNRPDGPVGGSWLVQQPGAFTVESDQLSCSTQNPGVMLWPTVFGTMQEAYLTVTAPVDPSNGEVELLLKNQGSLTECDSLQVDFQPDEDGGTLNAYDCGDYASPLSPGVPFLLVPGDQFGARVCADGTVVAFKNGVFVHAWDASFFPLSQMGGRIGFLASGVLIPMMFDNFGGG